MTESHPSNFVNRALDSLRDHSIPDGPPAELLEATAVRLHDPLSQSVTLQMLRRKWMFRLARFSSITAICTLIVVSTTWLGVTNHSATIAFADVQQQVKKIRSVRYVDTRLTEHAAGDVDESKQVEIDGKKAIPEKSRHVTGDMYQPRIVRVKGPYLQRTEVLDSNGEIESIRISDFKHGKHVTLLPKEKRFIETHTQVILDIDTGKTTEEKIKPAPDVDLCQICEVPAQATTRLSARTLEGKQVVGFYWEEQQTTKMGSNTWERTYWVDPHTKLPVRIEVCYHSTDKRNGRSDWVQSGFVFDSEFSADLFSTEPPQGYQRESQNITGIKVD